MEDYIIRLKNINKSYGIGKNPLHVLKGIDLEIKKGELLSIMGAMNAPTSGKFIVDELDVYSLKQEQRADFRREFLGFVFQSFHLMPYLTVYENIKLVCTGISQQQSMEDYLGKCSLLPLKNKYPSELSVGEKQRTAFLRAIISKPDILLADEPTGNLDPLNSSIIMSMTEDFHISGGTVLLVSHDPESSKYAGRYLTLDSGKLS